MSDEKVNEQKDDAVEVEQPEVAPLSDEDLDSIAGGGAARPEDCTGCGGTGCCTTGDVAVA